MLGRHPVWRSFLAQLLPVIPLPACLFKRFWPCYYSPFTDIQVKDFVGLGKGGTVGGGGGGGGY